MLYNTANYCDMNQGPITLCILPVPENSLIENSISNLASVRQLIKQNDINDPEYRHSKVPFTQYAFPVNGEHRTEVNTCIPHSNKCISCDLSVVHHRVLC